FFGLMILILVFATWGAPGEEAAAFWHIVHAYRWYLTALFAAGLGTVLAGWFKLDLGKVGFTAMVVGGTAYLFPDVPELSFGLGVLLLSLSAVTSGEELQSWIEESWGFAKLIMPLLLAGVLVAGIFFGMPGEDDGLIPPSWVAGLVGENTLVANFLASVAGALMYFATLTEIPILKGLLGSGMAEGPALSLLLAGPAVSLPNLLVIHSVLGTKKTSVFFIIVVVMSSLAGYGFGIIF
ncbi:MAG: permease, partial [bacterium]